MLKKRHKKEGRKEKKNRGLKPHSTKWEKVSGWQELEEALRSTAQSVAAAAEEKLIVF